MRVLVNGARLWFDVEGVGLVPDGHRMAQRPTVILLHGGPGSFDHSYFKPDFRCLSEVAQVVYLDLRGHGRSDWGIAEDWSFEQAADDVRAFCDAVDIANPIVLGHSLGGPVAIAYGSRHADHPGGLVLQSTMARFDLDRVVDGFREIGGDAVAEIVRRAYLRDDNVTTEEWDRCWKLFGPWVPGAIEKGRIPRNDELNAAGVELMLRFDLVAALDTIRCPTLISVGKLDPISPVWAAEEIAAGIQDGLSTLDVIEGAGHFPWRDAPERYWAVLNDFVASLSNH